MKYRNKILEEIYKSTLKFLTPLNPDQTYATVLNEAIKLVKADNGAIHLCIQNKFKVVYASLDKFYSIKPRKKGNIHKAFTSKEIVIAGVSNFIGAHNQLRDLNIKSAIFIPLSNKNSSIGVLALNSGKEEYFSRKEQEILKLFGSLASLAITKAQLYSEAKKALESRDSLISMTAHELRTPLTTVGGYIQLLQNKFSSADTIEGKWIKDLAWESQRLNILVNEMLEIDRIEAGNFLYNWKECSLKEILSQALNEFSFNHPKYKILMIDKVKKDKDKIIGDFTKLLQVVNNLLDNAAKFSSPDKNITIILKEQSQNIVLIIKDKGCGIPKKDITHVFEKFYRVSNHTREGMGLGLFLTKNIITHHSGIITIQSKENIGTTIKIKIPKIKYDNTTRS